MSEEKKKTYGKITEDMYASELAKITAKSVEEQAMHFLNAFVMEFRSSFTEVLDIAAEFKKFLPKNSSIIELDEQHAHYFLEKRGQATTVKEVRDYMAIIDLDKNHNISFIEFCVWHYKKDLNNLFNPKGQASEEVIKAFQEAIAAYQKVLAQKAAREQKMNDLAEEAKKGGVKGKTAAATLAQMQNEDLLAQNKAEITSAAKKRAAEKKVNEDDGSAAREAAIKEEAKKVADAKAAKEAEDKKKQKIVKLVLLQRPPYSRTND